MNDLKVSPGVSMSEDRTQPATSICLWIEGRGWPYIFYRTEVREMRDWMTQWLERADKAYEELGPDNL